MSNPWTLKTNYQSRPILCWHDLSVREQRDFDYLNSAERQDCAEFVRYRGVIYDLHDLERGLGSGPYAAMPQGLESWHNYLTDSYFSGIAFRWAESGVICATFYC